MEIYEYIAVLMGEEEEEGYYSFIYIPRDGDGECRRIRFSLPSYGL